MFWQGLASLLRNDTRAEIIPCSSLEDLRVREAQDRVDVVIVPWSRRSDGHPWVNRLGAVGCRTIIGVDDTTNETVLWARQIDRQALLDLTHLFGRERSGAYGDVIEQVESVAEAALAARAEGCANRMQALLLWAELMVRMQLATLGDEASEETHVPGLTCGLGHARALMRAVPGENALTLGASIRYLETLADPDGTVLFGPRLPLGDLDRRILALVLAPELDGRFHVAYGYLQNDLTRSYATPALLADLLRPHGADSLAIWRAVFVDGPLARLRLVEADLGVDGRLGPDARLRAPPDLVEHLAFGRIADATLEPVLRLGSTAYGLARGDDDARSLVAAIEDGARLIQLVAPRPVETWAEAALASAGMPCLAVDLSRIGGEDHAGLDRLAARIARVALILDAVPMLLRAPEGVPVQQVAELLLRRNAVVAADVAQPWTPPAGIETRIVKPRASARAVTDPMWREAARLNGFEIDDKDAVELAVTRRDDPSVVMSVCRQAAATCPAGSRIDLKTLQDIARSLTAPSVATVARRIRPAFDWRDIVLPEDRLERLREITLHVRHAGRVMHDWGYAARLPYGQGIAALFTGASGTGKTMAAQVIAADLGVEVLQVDLARTVSKYIGETEKHIDQAFDEAERASGVLLFDEAEALFGKRSEVKDAHDRYANVEIAYLLQRLEQYRGVAILTTNFRQNLDAAFVRRLRFVIDFPTPDAEQRLEIWRRAFPAAAPRGEELALDFLARRFQLTGGQIQQIALTAAFLGADSGGIEMAHVIAATRQQLAKLGMMSAEKALAEAPFLASRSAER
jgi:ATP-dependent 26S proteasome regulatory subunit